MRKTELCKAIDQYQELAAQIAQLEKQKTAVADRIKTAMGDADELQVGDNTVRYKEVTSNRFDARAFAESHKRLYTQFCKPQTVRRFTVA